MESLEEMEPRLIDLDNKIKNLSDEDPELDSLRAVVASLRTRHITLESQACRYKQKLEVRVLDIVVLSPRFLHVSTSSTGCC